MPSLHETQATFRAAVTGSDATALLGLLRCPADPAARLEIYRRHHRESFRRHLRGRYPTLEWLLGTPLLQDIADATLRRAPPRVPSMAEYGRELLDAVHEGAWVLPPYAGEVALLDWTLGWLSVSVAAPALAIDALAKVEPQKLAEVTLGLQPGLAYAACDWPVDELVQLRLADDVPDTLSFEPGAVRLELRGGAGRFSLRRLVAGEFAFRDGLARGHSLGRAAAAALAAQSSFDLPAALAALFAEGLVISHSGDTSHA